MPIGPWDTLSTIEASKLPRSFDSHPSKNSARYIDKTVTTHLVKGQEWRNPILHEHKLGRSSTCTSILIWCASFISSDPRYLYQTLLFRSCVGIISTRVKICRKKVHHAYNCCHAHIPIFPFSVYLTRIPLALLGKYTWWPSVHCSLTSQTLFFSSQGQKKKVTKLDTCMHAASSDGATSQVLTWPLLTLRGTCSKLQTQPIAIFVSY